MLFDDGMSLAVPHREDVSFGGVRGPEGAVEVCLAKLGAVAVDLFGCCGIVDTVPTGSKADDRSCDRIQYMFRKEGRGSRAQELETKICAYHTSGAVPDSYKRSHLSGDFVAPKV